MANMYPSAVKAFATYNSNIPSSTVRYNSNQGNVQQIPPYPIQPPRNNQQMPQNYQQLPQNYQQMPQNYQQMPQNYQQMPQNYQQTTQNYPKPDSNIYMQPPPPYATNNQSQYNADHSFFANSFDDNSVRRAFIKKVYSLLSLQLLVTSLFIALCTLHEDVKQFILENRFILYMAQGAMFVILIVLVCCESVRRKHPLNLIMLGLFTLAMSLLIGAMAASYAPEAVLLAAGITAFLTISLTAFAFQTKIDFTGMGVYLFAFSICMFVFGILLIFFYDKLAMIVYCSLAAFMFCCYLIFDTQLMLGGKHKYALSPDEYIMATLNLYIDIVYIFMYVLALIGFAQE